ncbi:hypothetical protein L596_013683 [Steinernema carpocapsae]|uniref:Uncharacterized protein n=1 Tax=Steinernema carpocapsae TaxID=34508 RepID=A0A4U5P0Y0_STECR|nr:hypothetical protein L596_013683 [Steinernema carpocapsae]
MMKSDVKIDIEQQKSLEDTIAEVQSSQKWLKIVVLLVVLFLIALNLFLLFMTEFAMLKKMNSLVNVMADKRRLTLLDEDKFFN